MSSSTALSSNVQEHKVHGTSPLELSTSVFEVHPEDDKDGTDRASLGGLGLTSAGSGPSTMRRQGIETHE